MAVASLSDLTRAAKSLMAFKKENPKGFDSMVAMFKEHRMAGYRNIVKMAYGSTPAQVLGK